MTALTMSKPWYREPWPWLLAIMPTTAVVAGIATAVLAVKSDDGLVEDDYYKQGMAINRTLSRDDAARALGLSATLAARDGRVTLQLAQAGGGDTPAALVLNMVHPTQPGLDLRETLVRDGQGGYVGRLNKLEAVRYRVLVAPEDKAWRLAGVWQARAGSLALQAPAR
jgi:hypothetical protein